MDILKLKEFLEKNNIKPTYQRLQILKLFETEKSHLTADEIYMKLALENPSLSKATIYNTLSIFTEHDLLNELVISKGESRYDIAKGFHGHFVCKKCKGIYDFDVELPDLEVKELEGFEITVKNLTYYGVCANCKAVQSVDGVNDM